jgi:uncharacterized membrane protein
MKIKAGIIFQQNLEAIIWITVLLIFLFSPVTNEHITLCPFKLAGIDHCPGCGMGRSLIMLLHGDFANSFLMHPLAIFALFILILRIVIVLRNSYLYHKRLN